MKADEGQFDASAMAVKINKKEFDALFARLLKSLPKKRTDVRTNQKNKATRSKSSPR
jgi:hypothetical protein